MTTAALLVIGGATATGKTGLAIRVAESLRAEGAVAEIISADSRQVYRGLDIGTAKASPEDRARVPHHGLDLVDPDAPFSVADFVAHARAALEELGSRGALGILAGGTGLYLRAIGRGLDTAALPSDTVRRDEINGWLERDGLRPAVKRLEEIAPRAAARIDRRNPRRVARALEIAEIIGDVDPPAPRGYGAAIDWVGLTVPTGIHREWIEQRARAQFAAGFLDEARALRDRWDPALPCFSALGYREAWSVLDGQSDEETAIGLLVVRNSQFARRQGTWFRAEPGMTWLDPSAEDPLRQALARARRLLEAAPSPPSAPGAPGASPEASGQG